MAQKRRRFAVTLIEMIIVMLLIAAITGTLAYNYKDALNEGKAFRTKQTISRIETILTMYAYEYPEKVQEIESKWKDIVQKSSLSTGNKDIITDGWGKEYKVSVSSTNSEPAIKVESESLKSYERQQKRL